MVDWQRVHEEAYRWDLVATLMHQHGDAIMAYCFMYVGEGLADEITQEVFVAAWQQLPRYRPDAPLRTWLFGIARNKCQQTLRNRARHRAIAETFSDEIRRRVHAHASTSLEGQLTQASSHAQLHASMNRLRDDDRILLTLWYWKELPVEDIADVLGKSVMAVRKQLSRAQQRLKELLHETLEAEP